MSHIFYWNARIGLPCAFRNYLIILNLVKFRIITNIIKPVVKMNSIYFWLFLINFISNNLMLFLFFYFLNDIAKLPVHLVLQFQYLLSLLIRSHNNLVKGLPWKRYVLIGNRISMLCGLTTNLTMIGNKEKWLVLLVKLKITAVTLNHSILEF